MIPGAWFPFLVAGGKVVTGGGGDATLESSFGPISAFVHDSGGTYHVDLRAPGIPSHALHPGFCVVGAGQTGVIFSAVVASAVLVNFRSVLHDGTNIDAPFSFLIFATERLGP